MSQFIVVHKKLKIPRIKLWCCRCKSFVDKSCKHWGTIDSKHETKEITVWSWIKRLYILLNRSHLDYGFQQLTCEENIVWNFELLTENVNILQTSFFDHDISLAPYCFSTIFIRCSYLPKFEILLRLKLYKINKEHHFYNIFICLLHVNSFFRDIICMIMQIMIIRNSAGSFVDVDKNRRMMIGCNLVTLFISFPVFTVVFIISECVNFVHVMTTIVWNINELFGFDLKKI